MAMVLNGYYLIDDETGEYGGVVDFKLPDTLETEDDLIGYMQVLLTEESNLAARKAELATVVANCERMVQQASRRVEWLRHRYEQNATALAVNALPKKPDGTYRTKTWTCPWGQVSLREVKPTVEIVDPDAALSWCREWVPEAIKVTEKVLITPVKEALLSDTTDEALIPDCFRYVPARDSVTIKTIGKELSSEEA